MTEELLIAIILFAAGLVLLIKGGDWFVDGASGVAKRLRIPELIIGATVVSIGTTLPEVMVSATSAVQGSGAISYGNAIGSIICNTALIAALNIIVRPAAVERKTLLLPVAFFFVSAALYAVCAYAFGYFYRWMGVVLLAIFAGYITISSVRAVKAAKMLSPAEGETLVSVAAESEAGEGESVAMPRKKALITCVLWAFLFAGLAVLAGIYYRWMGAVLLVVCALYTALSVFDLIRLKRGASSENACEELPAAEENARKKEGENAGIGSSGEKLSLIKDAIFLVLGAALIAVGAKLLVDKGIEIAGIIGIPQSVIALTFVALGTSLPELVTAITSIIKKHSDLSLGNLIGANLFNIVLVCGLSVSIAPFAVPSEAVFLGMNRSFVIDIPVMFAVLLVLTLPALLRGKLSRLQGVILLAIYAAFMVMQFAF